MRLLIVDDNQRFCMLVAKVLADVGMLVDVASTAAEFSECCKTNEYNGYLIDLLLPDQSGLTLIRNLRRSGDAKPVLIMTGRGEVTDRVIGLDAGADDYLVKPFHQDELLARVRALLRRQPKYLADLVKIGAIEVCFATGKVHCCGQQLDLRPSELRLLALLVRNLGEVVGRSGIENSVANSDGIQSSNAVDKLVSRLRKSLREQPTGLELKTVYGRGYRLEVV